LKVWSLEIQTRGLKGGGLRVEVSRDSPEVASCRVEGQADDSSQGLGFDQRVHASRDPDQRVKRWWTQGWGFGV